MVLAIEAVCQAGQIVPLEPVQFEENEHLLIVRMPALRAPVQPACSTVSAADELDWQCFAGVLKDSSAWQGEPLSVQEAMRRDWD